MSVRLIWTASNFPIAKLIQAVTKDPTVPVKASHIMLGYDDALFGGPWVSESTIGGVKNRPAERSMHNVVAIVECLFDAKPALEDVRKFIGDGFDYPGLVFVGWAKLLWKLFKVKVKSPWRSTKAQFCSEYIGRVLLAAEKHNSIPKLNGLYENPEKNYPIPLLKMALSYPKHFKVTYLKGQ